MGSMFPRHFGLQAFKAWKLFKTHQGTFGNDSLPRFFDGIGQLAIAVVPHLSNSQVVYFVIKSQLASLGRSSSSFKRNQTSFVTLFVKNLAARHCQVCFNSLKAPSKRHGLACELNAYQVAMGQENSRDHRFHRSLSFFPQYQQGIQRFIDR